MQTLLGHLRGPLLHVAGFSLCINLLMLIPAVFMLQVFDRVLVSRSGETLVLLMLGAGIGLAMLLALDQVRARLQAAAGNIIGESLAPEVTRLLVVQGARRGRVTTEGLRDVNALRALFSAQGLLALFDAPWLLVYVAIIWFAHPWLGVTALLAALLMLAVAAVNDLVTRRGHEQHQQATTAATRYLESSLGNAEVAHALGMGEALIARWRRQSAEVARQQAPVVRRAAAIAALTRMLRQAVQVVMLAIGAYLVITARASPGVTIACTILLGRALAPVEQIVGSWKVLAEGRAAFGRLSTLFASQAAGAPPMPLPPPEGDLDAERLSFRAPQSDRLLLQGISLHLAAGESLAIIGASGAGKSTLLRVLAGLWPPTEGVVRLDRSDLGLWPREQLGPWFGYVPQAVELFAGTVAENIARLADVDPERVVEAARRARIHEMVKTLPQGYDTFIEPGGTLLSPGQRQRIALARALYGHPKVLLLDEPNANLDGTGEMALAEALQALRGQVTVVVVTHRTTLIQHVDKLLVLDAGKVLQYGPVAAVMKALQGPRIVAPEATGIVAVPAAAAAAAGGAA